MDLREFVAQPRGWAWGGVSGDDCTTFAGSWVLAHAGIDPAAGVRGTYSTAAEAKAIVDRFGGIAALGAAMLEPHGFRRVQAPLDGDVGIVSAVLGTDPENCADGLIPGICFGPLWAVMSARGPQVKALRFTGIAWRIA